MSGIPYPQSGRIAPSLRLGYGPIAPLGQPRAPHGFNTDADGVRKTSGNRQRIYGNPLFSS